jgi:hypothetical protein
MTKEKLQERIDQLEAERKQVEATLLAYAGAIQDCQYWLKQLEETDGKADTEQSN